MMNLVDAAVAMKGQLSGENSEFTSVSTDTRTLKQGDLFIALKGPNFNGHNYIELAESLGACAVVVSEDVAANVPRIKVENTQFALGALGAAWKQRYNLPTVAITGSCGKTSVKEMVAAILSLKGKTLATKGNFNNEIGVPLTLLSLDSSHEFAVIELGANHIGEIAYTTELTKPDVAVITNAGSAHIEGFGSAENVARAKGEIYQGLSVGGKAVINLDDQYSDYWQQITSGYEQVGFSMENPEAAFFASDIEPNQSGQYAFKLHTPTGVVDIRLPVLGKHNVLNAVVAATLTSLLGASIDQIKAGLESLAPIKGRLYPVQLTHGAIIDDSYNANPVSIKAAAEMLGDLDGRTCIVLGDMAELGAHAPSMHREVGECTALQGIDCLVAKGKHAADYLVGFNKFKGDDQACVRFDTFEEIEQYLKQQAYDTVLVKGSRSAAMENVVQLMTESNNQEGVN